MQAVVSMNHNVASSQPFVLQLSSFFPFCGLSYLGVITGSDVDKITRAVVGGKSFQSLFFPLYSIIAHSICYPIVRPLIFRFFSCSFVHSEDEDDYMSCLSDVKCGAPLSGLCF